MAKTKTKTKQIKKRGNMILFVFFSLGVGFKNVRFFFLFFLFLFFFPCLLENGKREREREIFRLDSKWDSDSKSVLSLSWEEILSDCLSVVCSFIFIQILFNTFCYCMSAVIFDKRFLFLFFLLLHWWMATFPRSLKTFFMGLLLFHQQINLARLIR